MENKRLDRKRDAVNSQKRFDEWNGAWAKSSCLSRLFNRPWRIQRLTSAVFVFCVLSCYFLSPVAGAEASVLENEGLALMRIVASPVNIVGFTYAECEGAGAGGVILAPLSLAVESLPGALAACADVLTGTTELLTCQHFDHVAYPWDSFDKRQVEKWNEIFDKVLDAAVETSDKVAVVANDINDVANSSRGRSTSAVTGTPVSSGSGQGTMASGGTTTGGNPATVAKPKPRVRHSSCGGTGKCPICRDRRIVAGRKCIGCGGTGICRACRGSGYAP